MPRSQPVASIVLEYVVLAVAMTEAVRPVLPAAVHPTAPAMPPPERDGISTPAPPSPETPSATTPTRRAKCWFFIVPSLLRQCPIGQYSALRRRVSSRHGPDATGVTRSALTTDYGNPRSWATKKVMLSTSDGGVRDSPALEQGASSRVSPIAGYVRAIDPIVP